MNFLWDGKWSYFILSIRTKKKKSWVTAIKIGQCFEKYIYQNIKLSRVQSRVCSARVILGFQVSRSSLPLCCSPHPPPQLPSIFMRCYEINRPIHLHLPLAHGRCGCAYHCVLSCITSSSPPTTSRPHFFRRLSRSFLLFPTHFSVPTAWLLVSLGPHEWTKRVAIIEVTGAAVWQQHVHLLTCIVTSDLHVLLNTVNTSRAQHLNELFFQRVWIFKTYQQMLLSTARKIAVLTVIQF